MSCCVIAEAGVNHNGSADMALQLVDAAARAGADAVKFQTFRAESLAAPTARTAEYQQQMTGQGDQVSMLRALQLPDAAYPKLRDRCTELGMEFMSTPFDLESARMLAELGMRRIKVPSGEITNLPMLGGLAALRLPIILSTGMSTLAEVEAAVAALRTSDASLPLTLLHCTSNYPTAPQDVNLRAMQTLHDRLGLPVGYSDHTAGTAVAVAAVALGAVVIEKHLTLDRNLPGPDHQSSLEPAEFARMVTDIRAIERALGSGEKQPTASELPVRDVVRRSVVLVEAVRAGQPIKKTSLALLRPGTGIAPRHLAEIIGRRAAQDLPAGHVLRWTDLST